MSDEKWPGQEQKNTVGIAPRFWATPAGTYEDPPKQKSQTRLEIAALYGSEYVMALDTLRFWLQQGDDETEAVRKTMAYYNDLSLAAETLLLLVHDYLSA